VTIGNTTAITTTTRTGALWFLQLHFAAEPRNLSGILPITLAFLSLLFVVANVLGFDNHSKLVEGSCLARSGFALADRPAFQ
jgi:hypothetical protein